MTPQAPVDGDTSPSFCAQCAGRCETLCGAVPAEHLGLLTAGASRVVVPAHTDLVREGASCPSVLLISEGLAARVKTLPDGRRQIATLAGPGDAVGVDPGPMAFDVETLTETRFCRVSRTRLDRSRELFPAIDRYLLKQARRDVMTLQEHTLTLGRRSARERLASFLLERARMSGLGEAGGEVDLVLSRQDIADYLGLTIETVSRGLTLLAGEGLVATASRRRATLSNLAGLRDVAYGRE